MSAATATAHIETLTAQVRTLVVGSRQVTLSVYRQLDHVGYEDLEPFGRVNDGQVGPGSVYVVGRHIESGSLVRASVRQVDWRASDAPKEYEHWRYHADGAGHYGNRPVRIREAAEVGRALTWLLVDGTSGACSVPYHNRDQSLDVPPDEYQQMRSRGDFCSLDQLARSWRDEADFDVAMLTAAEHAYRAAGALPLIVLAGLR